MARPRNSEGFRLGGWGGCCTLSYGWSPASGGRGDAAPKATSTKVTEQSTEHPLRILTNRSAATIVRCYHVNANVPWVPWVCASPVMPHLLRIWGWGLMVAPPTAGGGICGSNALRLRSYWSHFEPAGWMDGWMDRWRGEGEEEEAAEGRG